jgi:hypothetical protein
MPLPRLALVLISILVLGEAGLALWRHLPIEPSTAPVFSFPPAAANFGKSPKLAPAIELYGADRGAEWNHTAPDGTRLTVFYFEWDKVAVGPVMSIAGHSPDECNVAAGFTLKDILPPRSYDVPGQPPLVFDATHFTDPSGRSVHMFKLAWVQGLGSRPLREATRRMERAGNALLRHQGAARVLQAGVFDAQNADHAWQTFRTQVLDRLQW